MAAEQFHSNSQQVAATVNQRSQAETPLELMTSSAKAHPAANNNAIELGNSICSERVGKIYVADAPV